MRGLLIHLVYFYREISDYGYISCRNSETIGSVDIWDACFGSIARSLGIFQVYKSILTIAAHFEEINLS